MPIARRCTITLGSGDTLRMLRRCMIASLIFISYNWILHWHSILRIAFSNGFHWFPFDKTVLRTTPLDQKEKVPEPPLCAERRKGKKWRSRHHPFARKWGEGSRTPLARKARPAFLARKVKRGCKQHKDEPNNTDRKHEQNERVPRNKP